MSQEVRISDLQSTPLSSTSTIRGVITLLWPYSSVKDSCAILLAAHDFRLRSQRGQVRVRFYGEAARAVAKSRVGISDTLVIGLGGARWSNEAEVQTPGKSVDGELVYEHYLNLNFERQHGNSESILVDSNHKSPQPEHDKLHAAVTTPVRPDRRLIADLEEGIFGSPAFMTSLRSSPNTIRDPFLDDDDLPPVKRVRTSFGYRKDWRYARESHSPVASPDAVVDDKSCEIKSSTHQIADLEHAGRELGDSTNESNGIDRPDMPSPFSRPEIPISQSSSIIAVPTKPRLQPVVLHSLPLPSPLPAETIESISGAVLNTIGMKLQSQPEATDQTTIQDSMDIASISSQAESLTRTIAETPQNESTTSTTNDKARRVSTEYESIEAQKATPEKLQRSLDTSTTTTSQINFRSSAQLERDSALQHTLSSLFGFGHVQAVSQTVSVAGQDSQHKRKQSDFEIAESQALQDSSDNIGQAPDTAECIGITENNKDTIGEISDGNDMAQDSTRYQHLERITMSSSGEIKDSATASAQSISDMNKAQNAFDADERRSKNTSSLPEDYDDVTSRTVEDTSQTGHMNVTLTKTDSPQHFQQPNSSHTDISSSHASQEQEDLYNTSQEPIRNEVSMNTFDNLATHDALHNNAGIWPEDGEVEQSLSSGRSSPAEQPTTGSQEAGSGHGSIQTPSEQAQQAHLAVISQSQTRILQHPARGTPIAVPLALRKWLTPRQDLGAEDTIETAINESLSEPHGAPTPVTQGIRTIYSYFSKLRVLEEHINIASQQSHPANRVDVIAVVSSRIKAPQRQINSPKHYYTTLQITDESLQVGEGVQVEVYRPWRASLPQAEVGDIILLRAFTVRSHEHKACLKSNDESAWCVWKYSHMSELALAGKENQPFGRIMPTEDDVKEEVNGPPVEFGLEERREVWRLRSWFLSPGAQGRPVPDITELDVITPGTRALITDHQRGGFET